MHVIRLLDLEFLFWLESCPNAHDICAHAFLVCLDAIEKVW